jgi:hypothetical protein
MPSLLRQYARQMFEPTQAKVILDGRPLGRTDCTGIHVASIAINLGGIFRFFREAEQRGQLHAIVGAPTPIEILKNVPRAYLGQSMLGTDLMDGPCQEMTVEALGEELLGPVIDGEFYPNISKMSFKVGPRIRIPKIVGQPLRN